MKKALVTRYQNKILYMLLEEGKEVEIDMYNDEENLIYNNIYVARVKDVVTNINAAFLEIAPGQICYFSLDEKNVLFLNRKNTTKVCEGDLILVQVVKEAVKTKAAVVSCEINLSGKYVVLTVGKGYFVGVSHKITDKGRQKHLKQLVAPYASDNFGFVVRTGAYNAEDGDIEEEIRSLSEEYKKILETAKTRTAFTLIRKNESPLNLNVENAHLEPEDEIVTDDAGLYEEIVSGKHRANVRLYDDKEISLLRAYSVETRIEKALAKNVWLKNGGYLVIEPTEALTVIDVNTGKFDGKEKDREETFLKINLEAAKEIARQLRLRNISGIILVDFINMKSSDSRKVLISELERQLYKDRIQTRFVDFTGLGLAEITRQKKKKPIYENIL
jgi:ribonuclease G